MKHYDAPVVVYPGEVCMKCLYSFPTTQIAYPCPWEKGNMNVSFIAKLYIS